MFLGVYISMFLIRTIVMSVLYHAINSDISDQFSPKTGVLAGIFGSFFSSIDRKFLLKREKKFFPVRGEGAEVGGEGGSLG